MEQKERRWEVLHVWNPSTWKCKDLYIADLVAKNQSAYKKEAEVTLKRRRGLLSPGDEVLAKCKDNSTWARGVAVGGREEQSGFRVNLIDYGTVAVVEEVRMAPHSLFRLPPAVTDMHLYGVKPKNGKWAREVVDKVAEVLEGQKVILLDVCDAHGNPNTEGTYCRDLIIHQESLVHTLLQGNFIKPLIEVENNQSKENESQSLADCKKLKPKDHHHVAKHTEDTQHVHESLMKNKSRREKESSNEISPKRPLKPKASERMNNDDDGNADSDAKSDDSFKSTKTSFSDIPPGSNAAPPTLVKPGERNRGRGRGWGRGCLASQQSAEQPKHGRVKPGFRFPCSEENTPSPRHLTSQNLSLSSSSSSLKSINNSAATNSSHSMKTGSSSPSMNDRPPLAPAATNSSNSKNSRASSPSMNGGLSFAPAATNSSHSKKSGASSSSTNSRPALGSASSINHQLKNCLPGEPAEKPTFIVAERDIADYYKPYSAYNFTPPSSDVSGTSNGSQKHHAQDGTASPSRAHETHKLHEDKVSSPSQGEEAKKSEKHSSASFLLSTAQSPVILKSEDRVKTNLSSNNWQPSGKVAMPEYNFGSLPESDLHCRMRLRTTWVHVAGSPVLPIAGLPEDSRIDATLRSMRVKSLKPCQRYQYSSIMNGASTVMLGRPDIGKTFGYILPLMEILLRMHDKRSIPSGYGPLAIIVCPDSKTAALVAKWCTRFANFGMAQGQLCTRVVMACGGRGEKADLKKQEEVVIGSEVLVSTPPWIARNVMENKIVRLNRLQIVVLDNTDVLLEPPFDSSIQILRQVCKRKNIQWITSGETWTRPLKHLIRSFGPNTSILFNNFMEAARYSDLRARMVICQEEHKMLHILDYMKQVVKSGSSRVVVLCHANEEVDGVVTALEKAGWSVITPDPNATIITFPKGVTDRDWNVERDAVLVCSDWQIELEGLEVSDANVIVHYSLPAKFFSGFAQRFTLAAANLSINLPSDHVESETSNSENNSHINPTLQTLILADEKSHVQPPGIVEKFKLDIPNDDHKSYIQSLKEARDRENNRLLLCCHLVGRGKCPLQNGKCLNRHTVTECDRPRPEHQGIAVFKPVFVFDGATFGARILATTDASGNRHEFADDYPDVNRELQAYFSLPDRMRLGTFDLGSYCAVQQCLAPEEPIEWHRAQIVCVDKGINVRLLDFGLCLALKEKDLWVLPEHLAPPLLPPLAVTVFIFGLSPCDFDSSWSAEATRHLRSIMRPVDKPYRWQGRIRFAFNGILVMDEVRMRRFLTVTKSYITEKDVSNEMMTAKLATSNPHHFELLQKVYPFPPIRLVENLPKIPPVAWAHFDGDFPTVSLGTASATNCIFFRNHKFDDLLTDLEKECKEVGERYLKTKKYEKIRKGNFCLVKDEIGGWGRARIMDVYEDDIASCFFVDHGNLQRLPIASCVAISPKLVSKLPFQAIECRLGGIKHDDPENEVILEALESYVLDDDGEVQPCNLLYTKANGKPAFTKGELYVVNVVNEKGRSFNKMMVDEGRVQADPDGAEFLEDIDVYVPNNEDNDDVSPDQDEDDIIEAAVLEEADDFDIDTFMRALEKAQDNDDKNIDDPNIAESLQLLSMFKANVEEHVTAITENEIKRRAEHVENEPKGQDDVIPPAGQVSLPPVPSISVPSQEIVQSSVKHQQEQQNEEGKTSQCFCKQFTKGTIGNMTSENRDKNIEDEAMKKCKALGLELQPKAVKYLTPRGFWSQTEKTVRLRFEILGVVQENVRLHAQSDRFVFICPTSQSIYKVQLHLYALVWWESAEISSNPFEVRLNFRKKHTLVRAPWPQLYHPESRNNTRITAEIDVSRIPAYYERLKPSIFAFGAVSMDEGIGLPGGGESDASVDLEDEYQD